MFVIVVNSLVTQGDSALYNSPDTPSPVALFVFSPLSVFAPPYRCNLQRASI